MAEDEIILMSSSTWKSFEELIFELASQKENPLNYILKLRDIEVVIDDSMPEGVTELWGKDIYLIYKNGDDNK